MSQSINKTVRQIILAVQKKGDSALISYSKKFDGISLNPKNFFVPISKCKKAVKRVPPELIRALIQAKKNIAEYHSAQKKAIQPVKIRKKEMTIEERILPINRAGVYIPGGRFPYPSSVLMTVIPAKEAGVKEVIAATPAKNLNDVVKAALYIAGADKVLQIGGAQAIAALAYGTKTIPKVDVIAGPGNAFVTEAKKQVFGDVGIDMLAGPSEVVIWADDTVPPEYIAEDLQAQAEHGPDSEAILITPSKKLAQKVDALIELKYKKRIPCIIEKSRSKTISYINQLAPEHLEILLKISKPELQKIHNAGAIFMGKHTTVAMGDYWLGPSHTLPTGRTARFSSGLSVHTFLKRNSIMNVDLSYAKKHGKAISSIADAEGLTHHAESVRVRK